MWRKLKKKELFLSFQPKRFANQNSKISARNVSYFLDITNPLEPDLNVSANVQDHAVKKFRLKCEESLKKLYKLQKDQQGSSSNLPKLMYLFSNETVSTLKVKIQDLGSWTDDSDVMSAASNKDKPRSQLLNNGVQTSQISAHSEEKERFKDEKRRQEFLKKKYLRTPKVRNFFSPKFWFLPKNGFFCELN